MEPDHPGNTRGFESELRASDGAQARERERCRAVRREVEADRGSSREALAALAAWRSEERSLVEALASSEVRAAQRATWPPAEASASSCPFADPDPGEMSPASPGDDGQAALFGPLREARLLEACRELEAECGKAFGRGSGVGVPPADEPESPASRSL